MKKLSSLLLILTISLFSYTFGLSNYYERKTDYSNFNFDRYEKVIDNLNNQINKIIDKDINNTYILLKKVQQLKSKTKINSDKYFILSLLEDHLIYQKDIIEENKKEMAEYNKQTNTPDNYKPVENTTIWSYTGSISPADKEIEEARKREFNEYKDAIKEYFNFTDYDTIIDDKIVNDILNKCNIDYCYNEYSKYKWYQSFFIKFWSDTDITPYMNYSARLVWKNSFQKKLSKDYKSYDDCIDTKDFGSTEECKLELEKKYKMFELMDTQWYWYRSTWNHLKDKYLKYFKEWNTLNQENTSNDIKEIKSTDSNNVKFLKRLFKLENYSWDWNNVYEMDDNKIVTAIKKEKLKYKPEEEESYIKALQVINKCMFNSCKADYIKIKNDNIAIKYFNYLKIMNSDKVITNIESNTQKQLDNLEKYL